MFAPTFLVRILKFVIAFLVIAGGCALLWYVMTFAVMRALESIEGSNREFIVFVRDRFPIKQILRRRKRRVPHG